MLQHRNVQIIESHPTLFPTLHWEEKLNDYVRNYLWSHHDLAQTVIIGLPPGGLVLAGGMAKRLTRPLGFAAIRSLWAFRQTPLVIGTVNNFGRAFLNKPLIEALHILPDDVQREIAIQKQILARETAVYHTFIPPTPLARQTVVLLANNVTSGQMMLTTLRGIWAEQPRHVVVVIPIAHRHILNMLSDFADAIITLQAPLQFAPDSSHLYNQYSCLTAEQNSHLIAPSRQRLCGHMG